MAGGEEVREVAGGGVPDVAVRAGVVGGVGDVGAALVARVGGCSDGDVVALLDFEGCELVVAITIVSGADGDDFGLGPLLALVEPGGAAEDG